MTFDEWIELRREAREMGWGTIDTLEMFLTVFHLRYDRDATLAEARAFLQKCNGKGVEQAAE